MTAPVPPSPASEWEQDSLRQYGAVCTFLYEIGHPNPALVSDRSRFLSALERLCGSSGFAVVPKSGADQAPPLAALPALADGNPKKSGGPTQESTKNPAVAADSGTDDDYLACKNAHPRDALLSFNEEQHLYTISGVQGQTRSVTSFCESGKFNPNIIIPQIRRSERWASDPTYDYYQMSRDEILRMWDFGRDLGTELHRDIEIFFNKKTKLEDDFMGRKLSTAIVKPPADNVFPTYSNAASSMTGSGSLLGGGAMMAGPFTAASGTGDDALDFGGGGNSYGRSSGSSSSNGNNFPLVPQPQPHSPVERTYFLAFLKDILETRKWKPYRTEWRIYDKALNIAGTIDFVAVCDRDLKKVAFDFGNVPEALTELPPLEGETEASESETDGGAARPSNGEDDAEGQLESESASAALPVKRGGRPPKKASGRPKAASRPSSWLEPRTSILRDPDTGFAPTLLESSDTAPDAAPSSSKQLIMIDWKRSKQAKKSAYEKQLNLYRYLLMKNYRDPEVTDVNGEPAEFNVRELYIVRLHPCSKSYDLVSVPINEELAKEAIRKQGLTV